MEDTTRDKVRRGIILSIIFGFIGILIIIIVLSKMLFDVGVICPFYELFGWYCPGCGATRMAVAILQGDIAKAFRYNAFIMISLPVLIPIFIYQFYLYVMKNKLIKWLDKFLLGYSIALLIFGILRNIKPFTWLSPII